MDFCIGNYGDNLLTLDPVSVSIDWFVKSDFDLTSGKKDIARGLHAWSIRQRYRYSGERSNWNKFIRKRCSDGKFSKNSIFELSEQPMNFFLCFIKISTELIVNKAMSNLPVESFYLQGNRFWKKGKIHSSYQHTCDWLRNPRNHTAKIITFKLND